MYWRDRDLNEEPVGMEEAKSSATNRNPNSSSSTSRLEGNCLSFTVCLQEQYRYFKAFFIGQVKKLTARNEEEALKADLDKEKMQVQAADEAEKIKHELN